MTNGSSAVQTYDYALFGEVETRPLGRIRKVIASRLVASWSNVPQVAQFDEVDLTTFESLRARLPPQVREAGLTLLPFVMKACAMALKAFPEINASLDASGDNLILKKYCHVAFAAQTPLGLLAPVVRDVDRQEIPELAAAVHALAQKAKAGKLALSDAEGACFTVSNLGALGGTGFTPVINAPELAILGVACARPKVVAIEGGFVARTMLPLCLVYDHRVIDGAVGARFLAFVRALLHEPQQLWPEMATPG